MHPATLLLLFTQLGATAPDLTTARQWFEAGQHQQVVAVALNDNSAPALVYLVARSHDQLTQTVAARAAYERLAARPQTDPWHFIGRSAVQLTAPQPTQAATAASQTAAERAVALGPRVAEAHFQLGLARAERRDYVRAAPAFEAAIAIDPMPAYPHYYAGLSYYQAKRIDLMAEFFESFLKLAPNAPERPQVESIMRTVRGRR